MVTNYPSERGSVIRDQFEAQLGDPGWRPGPGEPADGVAYIAQQLVERGWHVPAAHVWATELVRRYPHLCSDDYRSAAEVADMLHETVNDPHDWDSHGAVLNVLEWRWRSL